MVSFFFTESSGVNVSLDILAPVARTVLNLAAVILMERLFVKMELFAGTDYV